MKALICGLGSIGKRHLGNMLKILDPHHVRGVEPNPAISAACRQAYPVCIHEILAEGLQWEPDLVMICTPNHLHVSQSMEVLSTSSAALFIEKPVGRNVAEVLPLHDKIEETGRFAWVACNLRYHPGVRPLRALVERGDLGRIFYIRSHFAHYLPYWRPDQDYRKTYSAQAAMGGGILLDDIHEFDLALLMAGPPLRVACMAQNTGSLETDVEETAGIICEHLGGTMSEIHMDYLRKDKSRGMEVVGEGGTLTWQSWGKNPEAVLVTRFDAVTRRREILFEGHAEDPNIAYEMQRDDLMDCLKDGAASKSNVRHAMDALLLVEGSKESSRSGQFVSIAGRAENRGTIG